MRLPLIKHISKFIGENDVDFVSETIETLENLIESDNIKDEELDVIGELLSNFYGAIEVDKAVKEGKSQREALNEFMGRVVGCIDK